jgi:hypothetical protein
MSMIRNELHVVKEQLSVLDEIEILDLLSIDSEMLVEAFEDLIEENYVKIKKSLSLEDWDGNNVLWTLYNY